MLGTLVNILAISLGSLIGIVFSKKIKASYQESIMTGLGLTVLVIGIQNALEGKNMILIISSIVVGTLMGEMLKIEHYLDAFGNYLKRKFKSKSSNVSNAFMSASLVYCVGAMSIVGSLEAGIVGNYDTLFAKSILDGISSIFFASTLGIGVLFSVIPVFIYQSTITLLSSFLTHILVPELIQEISAIGGVLIFAIGFNLLNIKKIKVGNMLPSVFIPILYYVVLNLL